MTKYENLEQLIAKIENQQKGNEGKPEFAIGEQLKEIATNEPAAASIIDSDIEVTGMKLTDAAAALKKYADANHGKEKCFCITPQVAEKILREFYGIPETTAEEPKNEETGFLDLSTFL